MGELVQIGIDASHARKGAVHKEVAALLGVKEVKFGVQRVDVYTMIATVAPEYAVQLLIQIDRINGVENISEIPQSPADEVQASNDTDQSVSEPGEQRL